jgi:hypothetical protein
MAAHGSLLRDSAAQHDSSTRTLRGAKCSLCGLERPIGLMVPDGGDACADLRWYCKDARSCTQRWTSRLQQPAAETAAAGKHKPAEPERDEPGPARSAPADEAAEVAAEQYV